MTMPEDDPIPSTGSPPSPSADDVRVMMRSQNLRLGLGLLVILMAVSFTAWRAGDALAASRDSANATNASLADNARSACITERRNTQADALGRISISANQAEVAGLVTGDEAEALRQLQIFKEAVNDWTAASLSLSPEVLNLPPDEGGCGPPILSLEDLDRVDPEP